MSRSSSAIQLRPDEADLVGKWVSVNGKVVNDETCERIHLLIRDRYVEKVAGGGWDTLYRDLNDGRYWELTYPQGEMHGGGPPRLTFLSMKQVREKYGDVQLVSHESSQ
jgi:hypothetical protein